MSLRLILDAVSRGNTPKALLEAAESELRQLQGELAELRGVIELKSEMWRAYDKRCEELYAAIDARDSASVVGHEEERESVALWLEERGRPNLARQIRAQAHRGVEVPSSARSARPKRATRVQRGANGQAEKPSGAVLRLAERVANLERLVTGSNGPRVKTSKGRNVEGSEGRCHAPSSGTPSSTAERNPPEGAEENVNKRSPSRKEEVPDG